MALYLKMMFESRLLGHRIMLSLNLGNTFLCVILYTEKYQSSYQHFQWLIASAKCHYYVILVRGGSIVLSASSLFRFCSFSPAQLCSVLKQKYFINENCNIDTQVLLLQ